MNTKMVPFTKDPKVNKITIKERRHSAYIKQRVVKPKVSLEWVERLNTYSSQEVFKIYINRDGAESVRATKFLSLTGFMAENGLNPEIIADWKVLSKPFAEALKKAETRFANNLIQGTLTNAYSSIPGIFAMKNMIGWTDKQHLEEIDGTIEKTVNKVSPAELQQASDKLNTRLKAFEKEETLRKTA